MVLALSFMPPKGSSPMVGGLPLGHEGECSYQLPDFVRVERVAPNPKEIGQ